jgi:hypothetical protein
VRFGPPEPGKPPWTSPRGPWVCLGGCLGSLGRGGGALGPVLSYLGAVLGPQRPLGNPKGASQSSEHVSVGTLGPKSGLLVDFKKRYKTQMDTINNEHKSGSRADRGGLLVPGPLPAASGGMLISHRFSHMPENAQKKCRSPLLVASWSALDTGIEGFHAVL